MSDGNVFEDFAPRAWVGCLSCYNNGRLVGAWVDGDSAATFVPCKRPECQGGDVWVLDHEGMGSLIEGECSPAEFTAVSNAVAEYLAECDDDEDDALAYWLRADDCGHKFTEWADWLRESRDYFYGIRDSFREFSDDHASEVISIPDSILPYFDWAAYARDLEHSFTAYELPDGRVAVFLNA